MKIAPLAAKLTALVVATVLGGAAALAFPADASESEVKVLVRVQPGTDAAVAQEVRALGGDTEKPLTILSGFFAKVSSDRVGAIEGLPGVVAVLRGADIGFDPALYDPEKISSSLYQVAKNIGADEAWKDGYTGAGIDVAVIDSGVAPRPEFQGRLVNGADLSFGSGDVPDGFDQFGHGTHMAGIIAGRDAAVSSDPETIRRSAKRNFVGIAPGARIVNVKVAAPDGAVDVSQVIAGINWVVTHRASDGLNIRVLNLSFGTDGIQGYQIDPLTYAVENAWRNGIVVVVSAGNDGYGSSSLNNPAYDPFILAVGASDTNGTPGKSDDFIADFSSRGDRKRRPDVLAPGRSIVSLRAPGSLVDEIFPGARVNENLFRGSGTSQAAAVVSGAVALLLDEYPNLTPDQVKAALVATGLKLKTRKGELLERGMKSIDVHKAADKVRDVREGKIASVQNFPVATGRGSLEGARGTEHVTDATGTILSGEIDVTGAPWDGRAWRAMSWTGRSWRGDGWNGRSWRGTGWLAAEFVPAEPLA